MLLSSPSSIFRPLLALAATVFLLLGAGQAMADSWPMPRQEQYGSHDGSARVIVTPRALRSQLDYFREKVDEQESAGQIDGGSDRAMARLERRSASGDWELVWERPLVNDVAPVRVLVANGGAAVATSDDWHAVGHGPNVVVIYGPDGQLVRALALSAILSEEEIQSLPRSVSSMHWGRLGTFSEDSRKLFLEVNLSGNARSDDRQSYRRIALDVQTGRVLPADLD